MNITFFIESSYKLVRIIELGMIFYTILFLKFLLHMALRLYFCPEKKTDSVDSSDIDDDLELITYKIWFIIPSDLGIVIILNGKISFYCIIVCLMIHDYLFEITMCIIILVLYHVNNVLLVFSNMILVLNKLKIIYIWSLVCLQFRFRVTLARFFSTRRLKCELIQLIP